MLRDQCGVSAVEFALIAPILLGGLLSMVDVGLAVTQQMNLDYVLRAGASAAMADQGEEQIMKVLEATASEHFVLADPSAETPAEDSVVLEIKCECTGAGATSEEDCAACAGSAQPHVSYQLSAEKTYNGAFLKGLRLKALLQVQVR